MTKKMFWQPAVALALLAVPASAVAADPVYFHKPGVDRETFAAEFGECSELADGVRAPPPTATYSPNLYAQAAGAFFDGFFRSGEKRRSIENVLRTCMADKGYRRVKAPGALIKQLRSLPDKERVDRLFALAAENVPAGEILPR